MNDSDISMLRKDSPTRWYDVGKMYCGVARRQASTGFALRVAYTAVLALIICGPLSAQGTHDTCQSIRDLYVSGHSKDHSVPPKELDEDYDEYEFSFEHLGEKDVLDAGCGHGSDAICEMQLTIDGKLSFKFDLATNIDVLDVNGKIYIVNGISEDKDGKVIFRRFEVHQLLRTTIESVCRTNH